MEATKNICGVKSEGAVDHNTVSNQIVHKILFGLHNTRSGRPNTMDSEVMLQAIEANLVCIHIYQPLRSGKI